MSITYKRIAKKKSGKAFFVTAMRLRGRVAAGGVPRATAWQNAVLLRFAYIKSLFVIDRFAKLIVIKF